MLGEFPEPSFICQNRCTSLQGLPFNVAAQISFLSLMADLGRKRTRSLWAETGPSLHV